MLLNADWKTYYCLLSTGASWNTLGLSFSQSRETLMAGKGHSPMISSPWFLLSSARLHRTPRKDTEDGQTGTKTPVSHDTITAPPPCRRPGPSPQECVSVETGRTK